MKLASRTWLLRGFLALTLFYHHPLVAETGTTVGTPTFTNGSFSAAPITNPLKVPKAPAPDDGRKEKQKSASNMAAFGAIMAMASCAMLMNEAMKQPPESPERSMLMAQAMQQCAQGAQNQDNANKNDEGAKALTDGNAEQPQVPAQDNAKAEAPALPNTDLATNKPATTTPSFPGLSPDDSSDSFNPGTPVADNSDTGGSFNLPDLGSVEPVDLPPLPNTSLGFDENGSTEDKKFDPASGTFITSSGAGGDKKDTKAEGGEGILVASSEGSRDQTTAGSRGALGGDSEDGEGKGGFDFSSLMNGFLGGPGESQNLPGQVLGFSPPVGSKKPALNIFQYASFRYKNAAYQEGRVQPPTKLARREFRKAPERKTASLEK